MTKPVPNTILGYDRSYWAWDPADGHAQNARWLAVRKHYAINPLWEVGEAMNDAMLEPILLGIVAWVKVQAQK